MQTRQLNDARSLPAIGFGTGGLNGPDGLAAIRSAIDAGYRLFDSAVNYDNEAEVGQAVRDGGVPREELRITSKIPGRHHAYDEAIASTEESLRRLGLDYLDLHLIHWPNPSVDRYVEAWRALVELRERGLVRSIGVSNFTGAHLDRIIDDTGVAPAVNQIELHPAFNQHVMREENARRGVLTECWSPLRRQKQDDPVIVEVAAAHGVTPPQAVLRWEIQLGALPIPKSADRERQRENLDVFGFELTEDEMAAITGLDRPDGRRFGDPDHHEEQ